MLTPFSFSFFIYLKKGSLLFFLVFVVDFKSSVLTPFSLSLLC